MKLFPKSRSIQILILVIWIILIAAIYWTRIDRIVPFRLYEPQEGDIVFQSLPHYPLVDAIESATNSPWSHCGIVMKNENGKWVVYEALGKVHETPLTLWVFRSRKFNYAIYRLKDRNINIDALNKEIRSLYGKRYDFHYAPDDNEIYCSELVYKVYDRALSIQIGKWQELGSLNWEPQEDIIREIENDALPLDRMMITPVELTRSPLLECIKAGSE